ncbi:MAG: MarR family transcriptional regulator [Candidatus Kapabacteria bacterium]|jgi:DNA-binding MarR family transcriptional regulator|nr:MarR family transcriptional regulator [Candidatus Kapabacteria bacterium]
MTIEQELKTSRFQNDIQKAELNIMFTASWLKMQVSKRLKEYDLTNEQFNVLRIIRGQAPHAVCVKDITERMIDRNSNTTRLLDKLAEKGLIWREPSAEDRRELCISLTKAGQQVLKKIDNREKKYTPNVSTGLTDLEAQLLNILLDKLRETL